MPTEQDRPAHLSLAEEFRELTHLCQERSMTLRQIFLRVKDRGPALFILILGVPFLFPVPLPGLSIPFGILIVFLCLAYLRQTPPYLPDSLMDRPLPPETTRKIMYYASRLFRYLEPWIRPRLSFLVEGYFGRIYACSLIILSAAVLALPLPPGTNGPPASIIVAASIALLERDGFMLLVASFLLLCNVLLFGLFFFVGYEVVQRFWG